MKHDNKEVNGYQFSSGYMENKSNCVKSSRRRHLSIDGIGEALRKAWE